MTARTASAPCTAPSSSDPSDKAGRPPTQPTETRAFSLRVSSLTRPTSRPDVALVILRLTVGERGCDSAASSAHPQGLRRAGWFLGIGHRA
jgi:hypothetical protein